MKLRRILHEHFPVALLAAFAFAPTHAVTYHVAPDGDDQNPGTLQQPFRTIVHGARALAAGDTLMIRDGTYREEIHDGIQGGDSWQRPTVLRGYPGESVTIRPEPGALRVFTLSTRTSHHIEIRDLAIDASNVSDDAVKITYYDTYNFAHHIRIRDCEIMNSPNQGILVTGDAQFQGLDVCANEFIGLSVHDNGVTSYDHGFYVNTAQNLVERCTIFRNAGQGCGFYDAAGPISNDNIARDNIIFDNARAGSYGVGLGFYTGARGLAYNNIIWGNQIGIDLNYNVRDTEIYNNVVFDNRNCGIYVSPWCQRATIENNIVWRNDCGIYDHGVSTVLAANLVDVDPLFMDEELHDFHLRSGSPAIDAGVTVPDVTVDFDGLVRPQGVAYDIGAYEYRDPARIEGPASLTSGRGLRAWPNPFRDMLHLVRESRDEGAIEILDGSGRRVRLLFGHGPLDQSGELQWDGRGEGDTPLPPGVYFLRIPRSGWMPGIKVIRLH